MKRYKVKVSIIYEFEFVTEKKERHEIQKEAESEWDRLVMIGRDGDKYQETEIEVE